MTILGNKKRISIVGLGQTGLSCARYLASENIEFRVVDSRAKPPMQADFELLFPYTELYCGEFADDIFINDDLLLISPGLSLQLPAIVKAVQQGVGLTSDIALFMEKTKQPVIAVTGSNGKSTVVSLLVAMFEQAGIKAVAGGNIGVPVLDLLLEKKKPDVYVLELSSFQLELLDNLSPWSATVLNVSEDHMDRYHDMEAYAEVKRKIYFGAEHIVFNRNDKRSLPDQASCLSIRSFGQDKPGEDDLGIGSHKGRVFFFHGKEPLFAVESMKIKGAHNHLNAMAAMALCMPMNVRFGQMKKTLENFSGLPHRCQWVGDYQGVSFYNDSKATNAGAAIAAIRGLSSDFSGMVLIAGGQDKGSDFTELAEVIRQYVSRVVLIGHDAEKMEKVIGADLCLYADNMPDAVKAAFDLAEKDNVVLLSPACASFDMFDNYQHRGHAFSEAVQALSGRAA